MNRRYGRSRAPRRVFIATGVVAGALLLSGCGDMQPEDLEDLFDQTRDIIDQVEEAVEEQPGDSSQSDDSSQNDSADDEEPGSQYEERMREAREDWDTYVPPPSDIPPSERPFDYATTHRDGTRSATEENTYPGDEADPLADYYTQQYGSDPTTQDGKRTWSSDDATTTMETNADGSVTTRTRWYDPAN